jgi:DNA-binding transcriptional MerR regulator
LSLLKQITLVHFSISQLEQFSGIKAHTIRIWEQRYNALTPSRSEGNTRYYDSEQLRRLLNIVSLSNVGYKISKLCRMRDSELFKLLEDKLDLNITEEDRNNYFISQLVSATTDFAEERFDDIYSDCVAQLGIRDTYVKVLYPLLNRVGLMWITDNISTAHEHFCSNLIKQKMYAAIDALPEANHEESVWILFLPEYEFHEIGLLFSNLLLRQAGKKVIYLGTNLPTETLQSAVEQSDAENILFFLVRNKTIKLTSDYLSDIKSKFAKQNIFVSGGAALKSDLSNIEGVNWLYSVEDFENIL